MSRHETLVHHRLQVDLIETDTEVRLVMRGKSDDRQPDVFLAPLLLRALRQAESGRREVVIDFGSLDYMNSSTYTPLVRMLEEAARGPHRVRLEYNRLRRWQDLSFSALRAFETVDGRISIHAR